MQVHVFILRVSLVPRLEILGTRLIEGITFVKCTLEEHWLPQDQTQANTQYTSNCMSSRVSERVLSGTSITLHVDIQRNAITMKHLTLSLNRVS